MTDTDDQARKALAAIIVSAIFTFFNAWIVMVYMGILHANYVAVPSVSYWVAVIGLAIIRIVGSTFRGKDSVDEILKNQENR